MQAAVTAGAATPNPGETGATIYSTTAGDFLRWNGTTWQTFGAAGGGLTHPQVMARGLGA